MSRSAHAVALDRRHDAPFPLTRGRMARMHRILLIAGAMSAAMLLAGVAARAVSAGPLITVPAPAWDPSQYDSATLASDAPDVTTLPTVHAVYVYPSDASSR